MRIPALMTMAALLSACVTGQSVGSISEFQQIAAGQIEGDFAAADVKVHNRRALIFTSYWTATTPDGAVYECSRDLSSDQCIRQGR